MNNLQNTSWCKDQWQLHNKTQEYVIYEVTTILFYRYIAICFSLQHKMTWKVAKIILVFIWIYSFCLVIPWLLYYRLEKYETRHQVFYICLQDWPIENGKRNFFLLLVAVCYIIPLTLIILCYLMIALRVWNRNAPGIFRYSKVIQKSKVKVVKMFVIVVVLFALSWLPLYTCFMVLYFDPPEQLSDANSFLLDIAVPIAQWLGQANSGMNPVIYCFFSKAIRKRTISLLSCSSRSSSDIPHRQSRFSSSRCMSVDYANGQITLKLNRRKDSSVRSTRCTNTLCESTFYDWLGLKRLNCWPAKNKTDM